MFSNKIDIALLLIRIAFGFRLIYGTVDNVFNWERMLEFKDFLASNHFPVPLVCAVVSVYLQFLSGISWMIGYKVRWSSALMILNFVVAILAVHLAGRDTYLNTTPAIHMLIISIALFLTGPGKYSFDGKG